MRYVLDAVVWVFFGLILVPVLTMGQELSNSYAPWLVDLKAQTEPARNAFYGPKHKATDYEEALMESARRLAFMKGCVDNFYLFLALTTLCSFGRWLLDNKGKQNGPQNSSNFTDGATRD